MYLLQPGFTQILTNCCCFYRFFKERDIASGRSPDRDLADFVYAPARSARLYNFAPDIQDAMELRALGPHAKLVKVVSVWNSRCIRIDCQHKPSTLAADLQTGKRRWGKSFQDSFHITAYVGYNCYVYFRDDGSAAGDFYSGCTASGHCSQYSECCQYEYGVHCNSGSSVPEEDSSFSCSPLSPGLFFQPPRGSISPPTRGSLLPTTIDDCVVSVLADPITDAWCEQCPGSESPLYLPVWGGRVITDRYSERVAWTCAFNMLMTLIQTW